MSSLPLFRSPGIALRHELEQRGWTQEELAIITGTSRMTISNIVSDRTGVTPEMAVSLAAAFGDKPERWLELDSSYRLSRVESSPEKIQRRAALFEIAPIRDMQRRGWIAETNDLGELEAELKTFFHSTSLEHAPGLPVAMRRGRSLPDLSASQRAWCFRARDLAAALTVRRFDSSTVSQAMREVRALAAYTKEAQRLPQLLANFGIRFVVVEPLPGSKIDGAAFWIDEAAPAIAVSIRYDRIDAFWFTVFHELSHIKHQDAFSVDNQLRVDFIANADRGQTEERADEEASSALIPKEELDSFIRRVGPLYSKTRIIQFAHRIGIHPGVIIGQLHHAGEIGFRTHREMLARIRDLITSVALTDGWGKTVSPGII